jgi:hypothetical protein
LPHFGHVISSESPQWLHFFQPLSIADWHLGHRSGPSGFTFPQMGQTAESGGISLSQ